MGKSNASQVHNGSFAGFLSWKDRESGVSFCLFCQNSISQGLINKNVDSSAVTHFFWRVYGCAIGDFSMITTYGIERNKYSENIQRVITLEDLFG